MQWLQLIGVSLLALAGTYLVWKKGKWPGDWPVAGEPLVLGLLALAVYLGFSAAAGYLLRAFNPPVTQQHLAIGLLRLVCVGILWAIVKFLVHRRDPMHDLKPESWKMMGRILLPYLMVLPAMYFLSTSAEQQAVKDLASMQGFLPHAIFFCAIVVVTPLFEELLFRGFIFGAFRRAYPAAVAVLLSALAFAVVHPQSIWIPVFLLGLLLGAIYEKSRSFWAPWLIHTVHNLITFLYIVFGGLDA